jgi:hypothetical protein
MVIDGFLVERLTELVLCLAVVDGEQLAHALGNHLIVKDLSGRLQERSLQVRLRYLALEVHNNND